MQGGFVPVGYDLYGQAAPFAAAPGMEGLPAGSPAPSHPLVPYMQGPRIPGAAVAGKPPEAGTVRGGWMWGGGEEWRAQVLLLFGVVVVFFITGFGFSERVFTDVYALCKSVADAVCSHMALLFVVSVCFIMLVCERGSFIPAACN